mmetsp:Transcript_18278/g.20324  ORF Transcript_18278/g.20324 Transcript_18278/m.20324 type:complete len:126 (-) Transcript_18278:252-629(-)
MDERSDTPTVTSVLVALKGYAVELELRQNVTVRGVLDVVTDEQSFFLRNATYTSHRLHKTFRYEELYVSGRNVKTILFPTLDGEKLLYNVGTYIHHMDTLVKRNILKTSSLNSIIRKKEDKKEST